jgi:hypothetical protein
MAAQSAQLAAETGVMRAFDTALQKTADLPARAQFRVLRYAADQIDEQIATYGTVAVEPGEVLAAGYGRAVPRADRAGSDA